MPIDASALPALTATVLVSTFVLAAIFGAIAQRTQFCTLGAVADIVSFGDWTRMRQWLLAIGVAILGTQALAASGLIDTADSFYTAPRFTWLAYVLGGLMFGFGMSLGSGCGSRTLVRIGSGNLKALIVFLVLGIAAYITLRGALALPRVYVIEPVAVELRGGQDLPSLLARATDLPGTWLHAGLGLAIGGGFILFALADREFRRFDNLLAGVGIGSVITGVWFVTGHLGHLTEHPLTLEETFLATASGRMESLTFVAPVAGTLDWLMLFSDKSRVLTVGVVAVFGVVAGSAVMALATRQFRWEGFRDTSDTAHHLVAGLLMGVGGVTALGCTIGQGLSGVSTLALGSFVVLASIITGAVAGVKYQAWRMERDAA